MLFDSDDPNEIRRAQREMLRALAHENFYGFYRQVAPALLPGQSFSHARHFQVIAHKLEQVAKGHVRRLAIAIPPRHGKSLLASVALPAWILGRDPTRKIICGSYGDILAKDFATRTRDLLRSSEYRRIFPNVELDQGGASHVELRTTAKGYRLSTTVQGAVTGKGAHFIVVDDPLKALDAQSEKGREEVYNWIKGTLMSRFDNPAEGAMIMIHQRLHMDDPIGRLMADGGWEYLDMPGQCVEGQVYELGGGKTWQFNPGDLLYPEMFDAAALAQQRLDLGEAQFAAQILQRPSAPGGSLFKLRHFQSYDARPSLYELIVQSWDPAIVGSDDADFTVCTTWGIWRRNLYLLDVFRKRLEFHQIEPAIVSMREKYNAKVVIVEAVGAGAAIYNGLYRRQDFRLGLFADAPREDKVERAIAQTPKIERKRVFLPIEAPWLETFIAEIAGFPLVKYDDQVDSMVQFLRFLDHSNVHRNNLWAYKNYREQPF